MDKAAIRQGIKSNAKTMLRGNYGGAIAILIITGVIGSVITGIANAYLFGSSVMRDVMLYDGMPVSAIPQQMLAEMGVSIGVSALISMIASLFLLAPLSFGALGWYYQLSLGNRPGVAYLFDWFSSGKKYWRSVKINFLVGLKVFLLSILPIVIGVAGLTGAIFVTEFYTKLPTYATVSIVLLGILLYLAAIVLVVVISLRYTMATYYGMSEESWSSKEVFRHAVRDIKGHKGETFVFGLSFLGWMLLAPLTCGLILLWLEPYMSASMILYLNYLRDAGKIADGGQDAR